MAGSPIIALVSLILLAAGVLFQFFVILGGTLSGTPEPKFYFLAADTNGIGSAPSATAWTFFSLCELPMPSTSGSTGACFHTQAALPFDLNHNFGASGNVAASGNHYYYLSRFMFAFYLIAIFFSVISLFTGLLALCTRIGAYISGAMSMVAFFFQALAAALMTAWVVQGRNAFRGAGRAANIGAYNMGFTWAAVAAFILSIVLFCVAGAAGREKNTTTSSKKSRFGMFGRKRSTRSRGSFGDSAVKEEYS